MANSQTSRSSSYSVFSFLSDDLRQTEIPVGVALWSAKEAKVQVRLAHEGEQLRGFKQEWLPYVQLISQQLGNWLRTKQLPYDREASDPHTDLWWKHLRNLLVHRVRLSEPKAIDCRDMGEETELLYEAIVSPLKPDQEKRSRVDRAITKSLGNSLSRKFAKGTVQGFKGRPVPVKRFVEDGRQLIILDGVNLAVHNAEKDADALVSRLLRIKNSNSVDRGAREVKAFVGYLASPNGLNGEAALVEWIEEMGGARTFDLIKQREEFAGSVEQAAADIKLTRPQPVN